LTTCANAWKKLYEEGHFDAEEFLPEQKHPWKGILVSKFSELKPETWKAECNMYPGVIKAIQEGLYADKENILVINTHQNSHFKVAVLVRIPC
jgi:hypothetical protein